MRIANRVSRRVAFSMACVLGVAAVGVAMADRDGLASAQVGLGSGAAWFVSNAGQLVLLDGSTGSALARVDAVVNQTADVVQADGSALVIDRTEGRLSWVDAATSSVTGTSDFAGLTDAAFGADGVWVLSQNGGLAQRVENRSLRRFVEPQAVGGAPTTVGVADGRAWVDGADGQVQWFTDSSTGRAGEAGDVGDLVVAGEQVARVDADGQRVTVLHPDRQRIDASCLTAGSADVLSAGSNELPARVASVRPRSAIVSIVGLEDGSCTSVTLGAPSDNNRYGRPALADGRVFVPDLVDGQVIVIDADGPDQIVARVDIGLVGIPYEVFEHGGFIWFRDIGRTTAGVIDADLKALSLQLDSANDQATPPVNDEPENEPVVSEATDITCSATPNPVDAGTPATLTVANPNQVAIAGLAWSVDGATPQPAPDDPQPIVSWATEGMKTVDVRVALDSQSPIDVSCPVEVRAAPLPTTTTTTSVAPPPVTTTAPPAPATTQTPLPPATTIAPPPPPATTLPAPPPATTTTLPVVTTTTPPPTTTLPPPTTTTTPTITLPIPVPIAGFSVSADPVFIDIPVTFGNASTGVVAETTFAWSVDDQANALSTDSDFTHTFTAVGDHVVTLVVTNDGASNASTQIVSVLATDACPGIDGYQDPVEASDQAVDWDTDTIANSDDARPCVAQTFTLQTTYDLVEQAEFATWLTGAPGGPTLGIPFDGSNGDSRGFAVWASNLVMEDNSSQFDRFLETHPRWGSHEEPPRENGWIEGTFGLLPIETGDHFRSRFGFIKPANGADAGDVNLVVSYTADNGTSGVLVSQRKDYDGSLVELSADLSALAGLTIQLRMRIEANGPSSQDWASWMDTRVEGMRIAPSSPINPDLPIAPGGGVIGG